MLRAKSSLFFPFIRTFSPKSPLKLFSQEKGPFSEDENPEKNKETIPDEPKIKTREQSQEETRDLFKKMGLEEPEFILNRETLDDENDRNLSQAERIQKMMPKDFYKYSMAQKGSAIKQSMQEMALQTYKKNQEEFKKTQAELRASILFEDILRFNPKIVLYEMTSNLWRSRYYFSCFVNALAVYYLIRHFVYGVDFLFPWVQMIGLPFIFIFYNTRYRKFIKNYVEKVVYDSQKEVFLITKRTFFGNKIEKEVAKNHLIYTDEQSLHKREINYINMKTMEMYSIAFKDGWKDKALFSHLIQQRIR